MDFLTFCVLMFILFILSRGFEISITSGDKPNPTKRKPILLVDMDGVIADYYGHFAHIWKLRYPSRVLLHPSQITNMYFEVDYPKEFTKDIRNITCGVCFFEFLPAIENAAETLNRIMDEGKFDVFLCSTPDADSKNHQCSSEKVRWVERVLGERWVRKIILTHDKTLVVGDYLIDDKPSIKGAVNPSWKHIVFTHNYNQHLTEHLRLNKWSEWESLQQTLLAEFNQTK